MDAPTVSTWPVFPITARDKLPFRKLEMHFGLAIALATEDMLPLAKQAVLDAVWKHDVCGAVYSDYIMESLAKATHVFFVLTKTKKGEQIFALRKYVPIAFVICSRDKNNAIQVDLDLLCARDLPATQAETERSDEQSEGESQRSQGKSQRSDEESSSDSKNKSRKTQVPLSMGIGFVLIECVIRYFREQREDIYLHALHNDLVSYYARVGFILVPIGSGCDFLNPEYIKTFDEAAKKQALLISANLHVHKVNEITNERFMEQVYYRPLSGRANKKHLYIVPNAGIYMILCTANDELVSRSAKTIVKYKENGVSKQFWNSYQVEFNSEVRKEAAEKLRAYEENK